MSAIPCGFDGSYRKSDRSGLQECVGIRPGAVKVIDTKNQGTALTVGIVGGAAFLEAVKAGFGQPTTSTSSSASVLGHLTTSQG